MKKEDLILKCIKENITFSDYEIARFIKENYPEIKGETETLRRKINIIRNNNKLKRPKNDEVKAKSIKIVNKLKEDVKKFIKVERTLYEICDRFNQPPKVIEKILDELKSENYNVVLKENEYHLSDSLKEGGSHIIDIRKLEGKSYKFGFITDTHLNSKYERLDILNAIYDIYEDEGITDVYHGGNWVDGECRFNKYEIFNVGIDPQLIYFLNNYPQRKGITTYYVAGDDHEGWWVQRERTDIGRKLQLYAENGVEEPRTIEYQENPKLLTQPRNDLKYLGYIEADVIFKGDKGRTIMKVMHPGGGSAYALSYSPQKIVESFTGGEKPQILLLGHYHKSEYLPSYRNIEVFQGGCFLGSTPIYTDKGLKLITNIEVGDMVLTHKNRYKKVTKLFKRKYEGKWNIISYGRKSNWQTSTVTEEHPFYVLKKNKEIKEENIEWLQAKDIEEGDYIFIRSKKCNICSNEIPYWMNNCMLCNPMDSKETRDKLSQTKGSKIRKRKNSGSGLIHMNKDILPFCYDMKMEGWNIVPVGSSVIPDAVGFKDGKIVLFELENSKGRNLDFKKSKYDDSYINDFVDEVRWIELKERKIQPRTEYINLFEGFVGVKVISNTQKDKIRNNVKSNTVYNFEVEDDNSYVAKNILVHNCVQDQTPFMRKKKLQAHLGGWIIEFNQSPDGAISRLKAEWLKFYDENYYKKKGYYR